METKSHNFATSFLIFLLVIFSLFPYIQILPLGTDSQPNALAVSFCLFPFCCKWKMNKNLALLLLLVIISILALALNPITFSTVRSLINYFSLFFITYVTYFSLKRNNGLQYNLFRVIVYTWFIVGSIQLFAYPTFMSFLIPRGDSTATLESGRGITCLAPEPTFYGIICLFLGMIAYLNFREKPNIKVLYYIILIQLLLYSRSSLVIFVLLAAIGIYSLYMLMKNKRNRLKVLIVTILFFTIIYTLIKIYSEEIDSVRIGKLLTLFVENPEKFIILDASANERFVHIFFPLYGCINSWGMPHGYDTFAEFMEKCFENPKFQNLFTDHVLKGNITRIMSGWGSIFFELGLAAFILVYVIINLFRNLPIGNKRILLVTIFLLTLINAVPFSNAIIPFFIGNLLYLNDKEQKETFEPCT